MMGILSPSQRFRDNVRIGYIWGGGTVNKPDSVLFFLYWYQSVGKSWKIQMVFILCLSVLKSSCSKTLFGTAPRNEKRKVVAKPYHQKLLSPRHSGSLCCHSNLFLNLAFECMCACLCGGINKIQQISRWATSEIIMVIAPQKRYFPQDSRAASTSFPSNIALLLSPGWEQSSSSPWRRCFLPLCWCFNNLHSNVISKLASIVSSGLLCAMKLDSILGKSPVVWEPEPAKVTCWEKNKETEITVALQPWMPYQLGNNREGEKKKNWGYCLSD